LTTTASNGVPSVGNSIVAAVLTAEEIEDMILSAVEKLEVAMEGNCEQIQTQATAVILDKVENCQNVIMSKMEVSQSVVLDRVMFAEGAVTGKLDSTMAVVRAFQDGMDQHQNQVLGLLEEKQVPQHARQAQPKVQLQLTPASGSHQPRRVRLDRGMDESGYSQRGISKHLRCYGDSKDSEDFHDSFGHRAGRKQSRLSPGPMTYQRFLEMEPRKHQLVHAYDCIRFNRPVEGFEFSSQCEENKDEHIYYSTNPVALMKKKSSSAATDWLHAHPIEAADEKDSTLGGDDCMY
jgi:hypothetical protein